MTDEKGLDAAIADKIGEYVKHKGRHDVPRALLALILSNHQEDPLSLSN